MSSEVKLLIGGLLCLAGIVLGLYVGVWVCFVGGIVDVITQIRAVDLSALAVAWGIAKFFFSGVMGWLSFSLLFIPGMAFIQDA